MLVLPAQRIRLLARDGRQLTGRDVVARQRYRALMVRKLHLKYHVPLATERKLGTTEVELEHTAEAFIVERSDRVAIGGEAAAPVAQCLRIMQAQYFNVGGDQSALLHARQHFR